MKSTTNNVKRRISTCKEDHVPLVTTVVSFFASKVDKTNLVIISMLKHMKKELNSVYNQLIIFVVSNFEML